ncbi:Protein of unknown function [Thermoanaerobacter thermohydrosulfuricus]|uniref:Uncharacterized protein n=1 Tax=Thermoanaerobacter thermohydrosulfuricus TaxID=1516 RepID=A0A1G7LTX1_THETY|nr:DUF3232 domain-containing protein [Thermoanaerobacter thermohydrosulfuricus]SDF52419.1 Protein of unknown function [Thermoanaerobacter thermohydrosulfuricus]
MYKEMFRELSLKINDSDNPYKKDDLEIVEEYPNKCSYYIEKVVSMESAILIARFRMEPEDYRNYIMELDRSRKIAHDALIAETKILNKICQIYGYPEIYNGSFENRNEIAEFAKKIVDEFFEKRQRAV